MLNTDNITINKQSSVKITGERVIYFDPFEISAESHDADIIFVTHDHYDHFDPKSIACIMNDETIIVAPESINSTIKKQVKTAEEKYIFLRPGACEKIDNVEITAVAAYNRLKPFHPKGKGYLGYVVTMDGVQYYVAGDTDCNEDVVKVKCDIALVPVGGTYTMDAKGAAQLIAQIKPQIAIPTHYGSIVGKQGDGQKFAELISENTIDTQVQLKL